MAKNFYLSFLLKNKLKPLTQEQVDYYESIGLSPEFNTRRVYFDLPIGNSLEEIINYLNINALDNANQLRRLYLNKLIDYLIKMGLSHHKVMGIPINIYSNEKQDFEGNNIKAKKGYLKDIYDFGIPFGFLKPTFIMSYIENSYNRTISVFGDECIDDLKFTDSLFKKLTKKYSRPNSKSEFKTSIEVLKLHQNNFQKTNYLGNAATQEISSIWLPKFKKGIFRDELGKIKYADLYDIACFIYQFEYDKAKQKALDEKQEKDIDPNTYYEKKLAEYEDYNKDVPFPSEIDVPPLTLKPKYREEKNGQLTFL